MKRGDFKKKIAEEIQAGHRGFITALIGKSKSLPSGSIIIDKVQVLRWKKMLSVTHYKAGPNEKIWADMMADKIINLMVKLKKSATKTPADPRVGEIIKTFEEYCENLRGFKPVINYGRDIMRIKEMLKTHSTDEILDSFDWFLRDKESPLSPSISTILSPGVFNQFLNKR